VGEWVPARLRMPPGPDRRAAARESLHRRERWRSAGAEGDPIEQPVIHHSSRTLLPATAKRALGLVRAIVSNVRAAPLGCLRPCSHP
jgi:hypothetical protein